MEDYETSKDHYALIESRYGENIKYIATPLLRASVLYWSIYFDLNMKKYIVKLLEMEGVYPELPMKSLYKRNSYHACCFNGNKEALIKLFEIKERYNRFYQKHIQKKNSHNFGRSKTLVDKEEAEKVFIFSREEKRQKDYSKAFIEYMKDSAMWITEFERMVEKVVNDDIEPYKFFERKDSFGNTPLHIASFLGKAEIVDILLHQSKF